MIDNVQNAAPVQATGLQGSSNQMNGIDLLSSIEMLLVKDYDDQMRSLGKQIRGTTKMKQAYRQEMEAYQNLLTRPIVKKKDKEKGGDKQECIALTSSEMNTLGGAPTDYLFDMETGDLKPYESQTIEGFKSINDNLSSLREKAQKNNAKVSSGSTSNKALVKKQTLPTKATQYYVAKSSIDTVLENLKLKLESLNEQSELNSLSLQSLTNQRKVAFETISNLVNKQHDSVSTMVRNIKG